MKLLWSHQIDRCSFEVYDDKPDFLFYEVKQVHGTKALEGINSSPSDEADALFTTDFSPQALGIKTADCLPIALIGKKGAAMVHAGWRGLHGGIVLNEKFLALEIHHALIGPAIQGDSYEVGEEFLEVFSDYPTCFQRNDQKLTFDLPQACEIQLKKHYDGITIINSKIDTFSNLGHNSFRRDKTVKRNYNILKIT